MKKDLTASVNAWCMENRNFVLESGMTYKEYLIADCEAGDFGWDWFFNPDERKNISSKDIEEVKEFLDNWDYLPEDEQIDNNLINTDMNNNLVTTEIQEAYTAVKDAENKLKELIEQKKKEIGCKYIYVDRIYAKVAIFPIWNDAQKEFIKMIFERGEYSRFDNLILETLATKIDNYDELVDNYDNAIDQLD